MSARDMGHYISANNRTLPICIGVLSLFTAKKKGCSRHDDQGMPISSLHRLITVIAFRRLG